MWRHEVSGCASPPFRLATHHLKQASRRSLEMQSSEQFSQGACLPCLPAGPLDFCCPLHRITVRTIPKHVPRGKTEAHTVRRPGAPQNHHFPGNGLELRCRSRGHSCNSFVVLDLDPDRSAIKVAAAPHAKPLSERLTAGQTQIPALGSRTLRLSFRIGQSLEQKSG
ncbi:hypothetical protein BGX38DRAFT_453096 [Terfezia claveryi]|nr:hypothetical protein BGX38DRAFT_453096 [Terfezia claveryi]